MIRIAAGLATVALLAASGVPSTAEPAAAGRHLPHSQCTAFPSDNVWHAKVNHLPVNKHSAQWVSSIGRNLKLHPDFGPSFGAQPVPYGIPITYVTSKHPTVHVTFDYASESDHVRYPLGGDTKIEGGKHSKGGDRHAVIVNTSTCRLYELYNVHHTSHGWTAGSGATWSLTSNKLRPKTWTSADAAGLPIMPGLLRYDEVKAGHVDHAIRFTADSTSRHFLWPARHQAGKSNSALPPMGARFRLKASFPIAHYRKDTRVVLRAMKTYGLILADNGSSWFFQGASSTKWANAMLDQLKTIPAKAFVAVDESGLQVSANSGRAH